jgi:hypothetical protein
MLKLHYAKIFYKFYENDAEHYARIYGEGEYGDKSEGRKVVFKLEYFVKNECQSLFQNAIRIISFE